MPPGRSQHNTAMDARDVSQVDRRQRTINGLVNASLAVATVPAVMSLWAPTTWLVAWAICYFAVTAFGVGNPLKLAYNSVDQIWAVAVGVVIALVPISGAIWSDAESTRWQVGLIVAIYISVEAALLPHLGLHEWRIGPVIAIAAMAVSLLVTMDFGWMDILINSGLVLAMLAMIEGGSQAFARNMALVDKQKQAEAESAHARYLAEHDSLTQVLNRRGITAEIDAASEGPATFVMFDANRFKSINDTIGHSIGDAVLVQMATVLARRLGSGWRVGRLGGDEFVAVARASLPVPRQIADPIACEASGEAYVHRIEVGLSAGVLRTDKPTTADAALAQAGFAMRSAKRDGGGLALFDGDLRQRWERGLEVGGAVTGDEAENRIIAYGQMIVRDGHGVGCELLARWLRPSGEIRGPGEFLPLLLDKGMMTELNRRMIGEGVRFAARFRKWSDPPFVSVNVSAPHLATPDLVSDVIDLLAEHQVRPDRLMIEITESERLETIDWETTVRELREIGVLLAIDDLGAGYSSIERMASLPITHLKFDTSFAERVRTPFGQVLKGIVRFARETGVGVVAEGIETPDLARAMTEIGVDTLQGFLYSRPAPLDALEQTMIEHAAPSAGRPAKVAMPELQQAIAGADS